MTVIRMASLRATTFGQHTGNPWGIVRQQLALVRLYALVTLFELSLIFIEFSIIRS